MILDDFNTAFESFVNRIGDSTQTSSPTIYKLEMQQLNGMLLNIRETEIATATDLSKIVIRNCMTLLFQIVVQLEYLHDNLGWLLINLYVNKFVRLVFPEIKLYWPILNNLVVYTIDIRVLYALIENSLAEKSTISWLTSRILLHMVQMKGINEFIKEQINTTENVRKFKKILQLNHDITTELNLIYLFVDLNLGSIFLEDMTVPYVSYIQSINSNFKRFIPCSTISKDAIFPSCSNCFLQPVDGYLLVLWLQLSNSKLDIFYINLMTLTSFRALPDGVVRLSFACNDKRHLRSDQMLVYKYISKFSVRNDTSEVLTSTIEFKLNHHKHYNWLVGYLKRNVQHRKVSINSTMQIPLSQNGPIPIDNSKLLDSVVVIEKRKFSLYDILDDFDDVHRNRKEFKKKKSVQKLPEKSCDSLWGSNNTNILLLEHNHAAIGTSISCLKNVIGGPDLEHNSFMDGNTTISEVMDDVTNEIKEQEHPQNSTSSATEETNTSHVSESLKLFTSNLVHKLQLLEHNILERKNELQKQVDREFAKIERMQKEKLNEISKYLVNELNKFM